MPVYTCPDCSAKVKTAQEAAPGQKFKCPACGTAFVPRAETLAFKDDDSAPVKTTKAGKKLTPGAAKPAAKPVAAAPAATAAPAKPHDELEGDTVAYGMMQESEEEKRLAQKNKPVFGSIRDRFKKSARGPAAALLVTPCNLLLAQGGLTAIFGLSSIIVGGWPLVFTDVTPSDEEIAEQMFWVFLGVICMVWGSIVCYGAVQMISLGSYSWAIVGAVFGLVPLLAGIFALTTLRDPRVLAGFAEPETGPIQTEADAPKKGEDGYEGDDDDDEEDEDDDEEEDERPAKKRKR
jgi:DNA-directed RNA polymerase subunit RPC12/RpoP